MKRVPFIFLIWASIGNSYALDQTKIDSLKQIVQAVEHDTTKIKAVRPPPPFKLRWLN